MKRKILLAITVLVVFSCVKKPYLHDTFKCAPISYENSIEKKDFNQNFSLSIPKNWKTNLFFNEYQSSISTADTTRQLTESFILDASYSIGQVNFDSQFYKRTDSIISKNAYLLVDSGEESFQLKPSFWYLVKGEKKGFAYHQFNLTLKLSEKNYFNVNVEIYGDSDVNERLCESLSILEKIKFLE